MTLHSSLLQLVNIACQWAWRTSVEWLCDRGKCHGSFFSESFCNLRLGGIPVPQANDPPSAMASSSAAFANIPHNCSNHNSPTQCLFRPMRPEWDLNAHGHTPPADKNHPSHPPTKICSVQKRNVPSLDDENCSVGYMFPGSTSFQRPALVYAFP